MGARLRQGIETATQHSFVPGSRLRQETKITSRQGVVLGAWTREWVHDRMRERIGARPGGNQPGRRASYDVGLGGRLSRDLHGRRGHEQQVPLGRRQSG
ncbi:hypothetical protein AB0F45_39230, partial [Streptomyces achromogenes]|uniref:hypothetical protein n=1 Tax=Streptomyces achromogenes TaxID=67255 RepID=UPI0033F12436